MDKFLKSVKSFMQDEEGLTIVEYVIGGAMVVAAIATLFSTFGTDLSTRLATFFSGGADAAGNAGGGTPE
ncbi:Flp family type IVb pilin [Vibrio olivae]|uniref:Flp family type IVb pilin n=1 Tax=Vibrio olivae TaxID=1243002 RepID=A0ABV5HLM6_9VIBR